MTRFFVYLSCIQKLQKKGHIMRDENNLIPVESDVNQFLNEERSMLDTDIAVVFKEFNIARLFKTCNIKKRCGHCATRIVFDLVQIPFLLMSNVFLFVHSQYEKASSAKNKYYRLLENADFNWRGFIHKFSFSIYQKINRKAGKDDYFVLDDTVTKLRGKLVEGASYVYDHVSGKSVLGIQKLVLGIFNGSHFFPINESLNVSKKKPKARSKSYKYNKKAKALRIKPGSPGAIERTYLDQGKLENAFKQLKAALKQGFTASGVLFDSWYCFNSFIRKIVEQTKLQVICQLKNFPRANQYFHKGKSYSLKELFLYYGKPKLRMVKAHHFMLSQIMVSIPASSIKMKIVFIQNNDTDKWYAFGSTDHNMSGQKILEVYSQRWSIEVFFKNCKQYLNYGKEQMSNLDSIIASDALVFMRYLILTYLAYKENSTFYNKFKALHKSQTAEVFGLNLLKFFLNRLQYMIKQVKHLFDQGFTKQAIELLEVVSEISEEQPEFAFK